MTIKCPGCGAALVYDAVSGKMLCTHCVTYYGEQEIGTYTQEKDKFDNIQLMKMSLNAKYTNAQIVEQNLQ